jgi:hypothetical protein
MRITAVQLRYFLPRFLFLVSGLSLSQEAEFVNATVIDQNTAEPVVFASVLLKGKDRGVITNMDGGFRLPARYREEGLTIQISSMGYQKKDVPLIELSLSTANTISLLPGTLALTEAVVSAKKKREPTARQIIRRAITRIPQNFPMTNFATKGYYRDYQLDSLGYLNLNEALLEVFDAGFDEIDTTTTKTRIYDYVQNKDFRRDTLADDPYNYMDGRKTIDKAYLSAYGGNEFTILRIHDAIRNYRLNSFSFINNINEGDMLKNHYFKKLQETYFDEENLYTIEIRRTDNGFKARGKIFIAKKDYAIHKLLYAVYDERKKNVDTLLQQQGVKGQLVFQVTTEYKRGQKDKMYLNYISFQNTFRLAKPPKFVVKYLTVLAERGAFVLHFNNTLAAASGTNGTDSRFWYEFKYKDKKIKFQDTRIILDSTVYLYPKMDSDPMKNLMRELVIMNRKKIDVGRVLKFSVGGLIDVDGNTLNTWEYKDYDQFREYFVQELDVLPQKPVDSLLMDKYLPILEKKQLYRPDNFDEYWKNTPLQKNQ